VNYFHFSVSFGTVWMGWNAQEKLTQVGWSENRVSLFQKVNLSPSLLDLMDQIRIYFAYGEPLGPVPWHCVEQNEWSAFQKKVYHAISRIPHGETRTYGWVAKSVGQASASRAVGQALRKNPLPILIPCHRVLGSHSLGGFMGTVDPDQPEMRLKRKLMQLEEEYRSPIFSFLTSSIRMASG
jgi:methylated-DNA-[protein]-cysteine S-methyltransferase